MVDKRRRVPLPTGEEAVEELKRIRRNERRRARHARKAGKEPEAEDFVPDVKTKPDADLKSQFTEAFEILGGAAGLVAWGRRDPKAFYAVWARVCIPRGASAPAESGSLEDMLAQLDQSSESLQ